MYAKLFSRIAQSSLMEEDIETRYCFMMLLAIADSGGDVIGTDVALARTVNLPLDVFKRCIAALMEPDPDSNSQVHEGRRLIPSDSGRGYLIVNYSTYRSIKTADEKKAYMREYMARYRKAKNGKDVTHVKQCKDLLAVLAHAEGEGEGDKEEEEKPPLTPPKTPPASPPKKRAPRAALPPLECEAFRKFWNAYPNRKAIANAEKAWVKNGCSEKIESILSAIESLKSSPQWTKEGGEYIPHPATWLNARGWEDEVKVSGINFRANGNSRPPGYENWKSMPLATDPVDPPWGTQGYIRKHGHGI